MKFAFYEQDITPPLYQSMPGYGRIRPAENVKDKLFVKAFAAQSGDDLVTFMVFDAVHLQADYIDEICEKVNERHGIPRERITVACNHTHTGIPCGWDIEKAQDDEYMHYISRIAVDCVTLAIKKLEDADLYFGKGWVDGISFCRNYKMKDGTVKTNPKRLDPDVIGPYADIDKSLPILFIKNKEGVPLGAVISFACHQDCVGLMEYSGDFSSELSRRLKQKYGQDFVSFYIAGASGNINHIDNRADIKYSEIDHYRSMGEKIANEAVSVIENKLTSVKDGKVDGKMTVLDIPHRKAYPGLEEKIAKVSKSGPVWLRHYLETNTEEIHKTPVQVLTIGDALLFALPGEMFNRFQLDIEKECGQTYKCLYSTHANGAHGYIPTPELMDTDIYEARLCGSSFLENDAGDRIVKAAVDLVK